jgi:hypothetical protein
MNTGGYLTLAQAGEYCGGRSPRWVRRHLLPAIHCFQPPGSGPLFRVADVNAWLERFRREPVDLDKVVAAVMEPRRGRKK